MTRKSCITSERIKRRWKRNSFNCSNPSVQNQLCPASDTFPYGESSIFAAALNPLQNGGQAFTSVVSSRNDYYAHYRRHKLSLIPQTASIFMLFYTSPQTIQTETCLLAKTKKIQKTFQTFKMSNIERSVPHMLMGLWPSGDMPGGVIVVSTVHNEGQSSVDSCDFVNALWLRGECTSACIFPKGWSFRVASHTHTK